MSSTSSAEFPAVAALVAEDEGGHGLVGTARLHLGVGAVALLALATGDEVCLGALDHRHLRVVDGLLRQLLSQLLQLRRGHLVGSHRGQALRGDVAWNQSTHTVISYTELTIIE